MMDFMEKITIRPPVLGDEDALCRVHIRAWQTAYRGILPDDFLDGMRFEDRIERWRERVANVGEGQFPLVAEALDAQGQPAIVGFVWGGLEREGFTGADGVKYDGEVYAIYLLAEQRGQGVGHLLMAAAAQALIDAGCRSIVIWVLKDNANARHFYEALGGILVGEKPITIGQTDLREVAYGWPDAGRLLARASRSAKEPQEGDYETDTL